MSESSGKKRGHEEEHEEHVNHEAWVIPYADVLTLLMALFLVLWALGDPNPDKTQVAAESFRREAGGSGGISEFDLGIGSGGSVLAEGGVSVLEGNGPAPMAANQDPTTGEIAPDGPVADPSPNEVMIDQIGMIDGDDPIDLDSATFEPIDRTGELLGDPLAQVEAAIREAAIGSGLTTVVGARRETRGLVVTIASDQVLFEEGEAKIQPAGILLLDVIAESLRDLPNSIIVEGHTDSRPISTPRYPSNWELSTSRATSVVRYLIENRDIDPDRVAAAGYSDTHPITLGDDPASLAKNRRVEIVVLATA